MRDIADIGDQYAIVKANMRGGSVSLLHVSISADDPRRVSAFLSYVMGGEAMRFPPFPDSWIVFAAEDDGTAIEVYPTTHVLEAGPNRLVCKIRDRNAASTFVHVAIRSQLGRAEVMERAATEGWTCRICNRGPFECVEVWLENRLLVEVLDDHMLKDYRSGMTASNWATMFGAPI